MAQEYVQISRDPFARQDLVRRVMHAPVSTCDWCGQTKPSRHLFEYGTERDDRPGLRNIAWHRGLFCCKGCHDSYHS